MAAASTAAFASVAASGAHARGGGVPPAAAMLKAANFHQGNDMAEEAMQRLVKDTRRYTRSGYPFGNPVSIEARHLTTVCRAMELWVADKTDGVRVCLGVTKLATARAEPCAFLMDRCGKVFGMPLRGDADLFQGSLFDCEFVTVAGATAGAGPRHLLLVFDVACIDGDVSIASAPLSARLAAIAATFPSTIQEAERAAAGQSPVAWVLSARADVVILAKHMARVRDLALSGYMEAGGGDGGDGGDDSGVSGAVDDAERKGEAHGRAKHVGIVPDIGVPVPKDGYILTPEFTGASNPGLAAEVLKIKAVHTIDLQWDGRTMWYGDGGDMLDVTTYTGGHAAIVIDTASIPAFPPHTLPIILEMAPRQAPDGRTVTLSFVGVRVDRQAPNNSICLAGTMNSVRDGVTLDAVLQARRQGLAEASGATVM